MRIIALFMIAACSLSSAACGPEATAPDGDEHVEARQGGVTTNVRYNRVFQKSSHNAYQKYHPISDQLYYHNIRSLELDIASWKDGHSNVPGDWFVYHEIDGFSDEMSTYCLRLSDCLDRLRVFHDRNPGHEVVTVFLDEAPSTSSWNQVGWTPADLDARILEHIPRQWIWAPPDQSTVCLTPGGGATTLRDSVTTPAVGCGWPTLQTLNGKFIFVLTGNDTAGFVGGPAGPNASSRLVFAAPKIESAADFDQNPGKLNEWAIFWNLSKGQSGWPTTAQYISDQHKSAVRVYMVRNPIFGDDDFNTKSEWEAAIRSHVQFMATDRRDQGAVPYNRSDSEDGYPFQCFCNAAGDGSLDANGFLSCAGSRFCDTSSWVEDMRSIGMRAATGNLGGTSDSFGRSYNVEETAGTSRITWTAGIHARHENTNRWAKGCLMARASGSAGSPFVAICRYANDGDFAFDPAYLRVFWRATANAAVQYTDANTGIPYGCQNIVVGSTIRKDCSTYPSDAHEVKLSIDGGTCALARVSLEGSWHDVELPGARADGYLCGFSQTLDEQGIAVASENGSEVKYLITNLHRREQTPVPGGGWVTLSEYLERGDLENLDDLVGPVNGHSVSSWNGK